MFIEEWLHQFVSEKLSLKLSLVIFNQCNAFLYDRPVTLKFFFQIIVAWYHLCKNVGIVAKKHESNLLT
jgi:hypothetical protein